MLSESGLSLTPASAQGAPLGGSEGVVDGASVLFANTETDTDTVVRPTTLGFEASTVLRSVDSPQQLLYRVGLPTGASALYRAAVRRVQFGSLKMGRWLRLYSRPSP